jgi:hypothetical protein
MAKRRDKRSARRAKQRPGAARSGPRATTGLPRARVANTRDPAFWFEFTVPWAKLVVVRFALFATLAVDSLLQLSHAPRYGAGGFEVAHLGWLDGLGPGRVGYTVGQLVIAFLLVLAALGVAHRWGLPIVAVLYAWLYFGSQLDSYQHHYLVAILLVIACGVPWRRPADAEPDTPMRSWALRLILVQLAIVYLWAAISKLDAAWLDGRTLELQLSGSVRELAGWLGFDVAAVLVLVAELILAGTLWLRPAWRVAAPVGIALHVGIIASGLEVGLFGYLVLALYLLVLPDRAFVAAGRTAAMRTVSRWLRELADRPGWLALAVATVVAIATAAFVRFPYALATVVACSAVPVAAAARAFWRGDSPRLGIALAHAIAILSWSVVDRSTTIAVDYYKRWGGSQRRLGDAATSERAYRGLVAIAPDDAVGRFHLGKLLVARGDEEGLVHLRDAQRLDPAHARAWIEEARYLARIGRLAEALTAARAGAAAEPGNPEARALVDALARSKLPPPSSNDSNDE